MGKLLFDFPDVLETGKVPFLFSLQQMKICGTTIELDSKEDIIACLAFGLHSSPTEYPTTGHFLGFDESCVSATIA